MTPASTQKWGNIAQIVSACAGIISSCAAIAAVIFVSHQISLLGGQFELSTKALEQSRENSRQASARSIYLQYMNVAFDHPQFIVPDYPAIAQEPQKKLKYKWFVQYLLWACDEVLLVLPEAPWINACRYDMVKHLHLFCDEFDREMMEQYYSQMQLLIREVMSEAASRGLSECRSNGYKKAEG